jgi:hypothetical protein
MISRVVDISDDVWCAREIRSVINDKPLIGYVVYQRPRIHEQTTRDANARLLAASWEMAEVLSRIIQAENASARSTLAEEIDNARVILKKAGIEV